MMIEARCRLSGLYEAADQYNPLRGGLNVAVLNRPHAGVFLGPSLHRYFLSGRRQHTSVAALLLVKGGVSCSLEVDVLAAVWI